MSSNNEQEVIIRKRKKGRTDPKSYKRNIIKQSRIEGTSHTNWSGKIVETMNTPVETTEILLCCKSRCLAIFEPHVLTKARQLFYKFENKNQQDLHLQRLMEIHSINRRRSRSNTAEDDKKPRGKTIQYYCLIEGQRKKVCKQAFIKLYNITKKRVERIANLLANCISPPIDKRGKSLSGNLIDASTCSLIYEHIQSFPVHETHYASRDIRYLSSELDVRKMHSMFLNKHSNLIGKVKYGFYLSYFKNHFSLTFGRPAQDTCSMCEELKTKLKNQSLNDNAKRVAAAELLVHKRRSQKFYKSLEESAKDSKVPDSKILGLCFDFMAVTDLPKIPVQDIYYFRQLNINNFGIHNMNDDSMTSYIYHEGIARKSPDDVISFLFHYLQNFVSNEIEELHLFCDNCGGQNKNHAMLRAIMTAVELKMFKKIKMFFPMREHSYLPCDRSFGLIKRKMKKTDRIYTINEYESVILTSSVIPEKFKIMLVDSTMVMDYQNWFPSYFLKHTTALETRMLPAKEQTKFLISAYHYFECSMENATTIIASTFIGGLTKFHFPLRKGNTSPIKLPTKQLYTNKIPIMTSKMKDLKRLRPYIPMESVSEFWEEIYQWPTR